MSPYSYLCSGILFPLHERLKGHDSVRLRRALERSQWWTRERLDAFRIQRLREFLTDIGRRVPYYREMFAATGFEPAAVADLAALTRLPLLGKPQIRAHVERLRADGANGLQRCNTGGSSGEPLVFYTSIGRRSHDVAAKWRATRWWGTDIGDAEIVVWGSPIELGTQDRIRAIRDTILRSRLLPAFDMSEASLDRYVQTICSRRPAMLFGYPSSIALIAAHARSRGARMENLGVRVVFVTSERLYDQQRDTIESVFNCPVANGYGGRDAGFIAHQCPAGGMHVSAEDIIVEILDDTGAPVQPGEAGEIVVTHMATGDFPFVRYQTGDVGVLDDQPCRCGRSLPVIREIQGRSTDFVVAADGTIMHGLALIYVLRDLEGIRSFKIIQHDLLHTEVLLVAPDRSPSLEAHVRQQFQRRLGEAVQISLRFVNEIPREASGKYRYIVSHVARSQIGPTQTERKVAHA